MAIEKISSRINKEQQELSSEINQLHPVFSTWATQEPHLDVMLKSVGGALEKCASSQNTLSSTYSSTVGNPIKDFLHYIDVVYDTLSKRDCYQNALDSSVEELSKRRMEKDKVNIFISASAMLLYCVLQQHNIYQKISLMYIIACFTLDFK